MLLVFSPYQTRCLGILFRTVISVEGEGVGSEDQRTRQGIGHHYHHTVQGEQLGSWGGREGGKEGGREGGREGERGRERERDEQVQTEDKDTKHMVRSRIRINTTVHT